MDYQFLFYCFLSVVLTTGGAFSLYSARQEVTAILYFLGAVIASIFFGFRWFSASGNMISTPSGTWPPVINYCPDFLTLATVAGEQVCIDTVGTAQKGGMYVSNGTQTSEQYLFHLFLNLSGKDRVSKLCEHASMKQVTWEGVWDGSTCIGKEPPKPPTS